MKRQMRHPQTEIYIQLAGVQLGPYSPAQVQEFVVDGMLALTDKARPEGSLEWVQVAELLAKAAPAPVEATPLPTVHGAVFSDPEPKPAHQAHVPAAETEPAAEQVAESEAAAGSFILPPEPAAAIEPEAPPVVAQEEPEIFEAAEVAQPAPEPEPPVVAAPPRPPVFVAPKPPVPTRQVASSRRLTGPVSVPSPILAAAPSGDAKPASEGVLASTTAKTKPLGPVAPVAPTASLRPTKAPPTPTASKSLSTTTPLTSSTRRMSRTAMARELQESPLAPAPRPSVDNSGPIAPPPGQVPNVAPVELDTTGPMAKGVNGGAAAAPVIVPTPPPGMPEARKGGGISSLLRSITAKTVPMRGNSNLPPGATPPAIMTPPPEAETKRGALPVTTPLPTRAITNPAVNRANRAPRPAPAETPAPVAPVTAAPSELEVPTEKLLSTQKAAELRAKAAKRAAQREEVERDLPKSAPPTKPTKPEPVATGGKKTAEQAAVEEDADDEPKAPAPPRPRRLENSIDFPALRSSLKQEASTLSSSSGSGLTPAASSALEMVNKSIDTYVTPGGIADLVPKPRDDLRSDLGQIVPPSVIGNIVNGFIAQPVRSQGFVSPVDFVLRTDVANVHLSPEGLTWKLTRIDVNPGLPALAGVAGAPLALVPVVQSHLNHGRKAAAAGKFDLAVEEYSQALAIAPQSTIALLARGTSYLAKGNVTDAINDFTEVLTIDPQNTTAYNNRGNARIGKGDLDGAIRDFSEAIKIDPTLAVSFDYRGSAKTAKNDLDGAIQDFTQAIALDPNMASAYSDRGLARQANGNLDGAIKDYTDSLALKPNSARTYLSRGLARLSQNNLPSAILDFDHAVEIDPKLADAYFQRGNAKSAMHDTDGAINDFTQTITLDPNTPGSVTFNSTTPRAADFQIDFRYAR